MVIASEAKQSMSPLAEAWIASSLSLLAMTGMVRIQFVKQREDASPRSRGATRPRFAITASLLKKAEGAGKTGCALHPRSRVQDAQRKTHTSIQVQRKHSGLPCAVVLRLTSRSPVTGFLATVIRGIPPAHLAPAPGRQDH